MKKGEQKWTAQQMIAALKEAQGMVYIAARKLGCSHQTIYNYANRYPKVQAAIDAERGYFLDTCEVALNRAVLAGEGWAVCFALKTLGKDRGYVEKQQVEQQGELVLKVQYGDEGKGKGDNDKTAETARPAKSLPK